MKTIKFGSITIVGSTAVLSFLKITGVINLSWLLCFAPIVTALALALSIFVGLNLMIAIGDKLDKSENQYDNNK